MSNVKEVTDDYVVFDDDSEIIIMGTKSIRRRFAEGWWIPRSETHNRFEIQAITTTSQTNDDHERVIKRNVFSDDESAKEFVTKRAQEGSQYHQAIILMLAHRNLVK